jgi:iron(III)-enterobactin esterase
MRSGIRYSANETTLLAPPLFEVRSRMFTLASVEDSDMVGFSSTAFLIFLLAGFNLAPGQAPVQQTPTAPPAARPKRPPAPARDPNTPGYVKAKELPDGAIPSPKEKGNFVIGPTYNPAPEMSAKEGVPQGQIYEFTMESKDSKIYPGVAREPGTFAQPDPADPNKLIVKSAPAPYTRKVAV